MYRWQRQRIRTEMLEIWRNANHPCIQEESMRPRYHLSFIVTAGFTDVDYVHSDSVFG